MDHQSFKQRVEHLNDLMATLEEIDPRRYFHEHKTWKLVRIRMDLPLILIGIVGFSIDIIFTVLGYYSEGWRVVLGSWLALMVLIGIMMLKDNTIRVRNNHKGHALVEERIQTYERIIRDHKEKIECLVEVKEKFRHFESLISSMGGELSFRHRLYDHKAIVRLKKKRKYELSDEGYEKLVLKLAISQKDSAAKQELIRQFEYEMLGQ